MRPTAKSAHFDAAMLWANLKLAMMRWILCVALTTIALDGTAEVHTSIKDEGFFDAVKSKRVKLVCRDCGPFAVDIERAFTQASDAGVDQVDLKEVFVYGNVAVRDGDHVITIATDTLMDRQYPPVPARVKKSEFPREYKPCPGCPMPDIPNELIGETSRFVYQQWGASPSLGVMLLAPLLPLFLPAEKIDPEKVIGIARLRVVATDDRGDTKRLELVAASDQEIDPKDLVRSAYERLAAHIGASVSRKPPIHEGSN